MSVGGLILERLPEPLTPEQYESASANIERLLLAVPKVVAVYRTGSVSVPGISDLDRIAVVTGIGPVSGIWNQLKDREKYAAMHTPFIASPSTFAEHSWYANLEPLKLVAGDEVTLHRPGTEAVLLSRILGIEGLVILRLKLEKQAVTGRIRVRPLLCELNNLRHCLRLAGLDEQAASGAWEISRATTELRTTWWERAPDARRTALTEVFSIAAGAIDAALEGIVGAPAKEPALNRFVLREPWGNVTLTIDEPRPGTRPARRLSRLSRRAAELLWRSTSRELRVPAAILSTLVEVRTGSGVFADRRTRVARYQDFTRSAGRGWSQLGVGGVFAS